MPDTRTPLKEGTILQLDKNYVIQEEIGRGASCLVYDAYYTDSGKHRVRIKECFPYHIKATRNPASHIIPAKGREAQFEAAKTAFSDAYKRNTELRNREGLINATIDSKWMHAQNNTIYSIMGYIEGTDYQKFTEGCLKDIFTRMKRLCKLLAGYHKNGYLHLDIKPGNILIPSDTKEQIVLFDFDSLLRIEDLKNGDEIHLSCSPGFSAPELLQGDAGRIGATADIFSIGAVIFYKIFAKTPGAWDLAWNAAYDFSAIAFADDRYQPKLFPKLTEFFHKTFSAAVLRYQTMEEVTAALQELEKLSDVEGVMLLHNFSYKFPQFVGRREELLQIWDNFQETDTVFLSGMGGIGKTELARKFASQYQNQFNRIVFLRFAGTVMDTLCSNELMIAGCGIEEQEPLADFYARKLTCLRQNAGKDDLILLDNFDHKDGGPAIEEDEHLNDLLNCGCKVLITSRESFWGEYDYTQIEIQPLKDSQECTALFQRNNSNEYPPTEWEAIHQLFDLLERHTMTISLLAKYLLHTAQKPSSLLQQMKQKEGITSTEALPVRHNKDEMRKERRIYGHLQILFDLSGFTQLERELMGSLSLLGPIRIQKAAFLQYFKPIKNNISCGSEEKLTKDNISGSPKEQMTKNNVSGGSEEKLTKNNISGSVEEQLENLIQHGWVEWNLKTDKISLHQIILDLAYHTLHPTTENCPHIVRSMASYFKEEEPSRIQRENRRRLAAYFIDRIQGADLQLAKLYYTYCHYIQADSRILAQAKQICRDIHSYESTLLAVKLCHLEIAFLIHQREWIELLNEEEQMEQAFQDVYQQVLQLEKEIWAHLRSAILPNINDTVVRLLLETADAVETLANRLCEECMLLDEPVFSGLNHIYQDAEQTYLYTCKLAEQEFISYHVKNDLYVKTIDFYAEDDFSRLYRCAYIGNQSKSAYYSEKLHAVRAVLTNAKEMFHSHETSYLEAGHQARQNQRHEDAIALYQKALEKDECPAEDIRYEIGRSYLELQEYEKAETLLLDVLRIEEAKKQNTICTLERLVELYERQGIGEQVIAYCEQILHSQASLAAKGDSTAIARMLVFEMKKARWEGGGEIQNKKGRYLAWEPYFQTLNACPEPDPILLPAYCDYAAYCREIGQPGRALALLLSAAEKYQKRYHDAEARKLYDCIIKNCRWEKICEEGSPKDCCREGSRREGSSEDCCQEGSRREGSSEDCHWENIRKDLYIRAVLQEAELLCEGQDTAKEALDLCRYAEKLIEERTPDMEYLEAFLYHIEANIYQHSQADYNYDLYKSKARQCNYYLLTERRLEEHRNLRDAIEEWKDTANDYIHLDNSAMAKRCLERMEAEAEKKGNMSDYLNYYSACFAWIQMDPDQKELPAYTKALYRKLAQSIHYNAETVDDTLCLRTLEVIQKNAFAYGAYGSALYAGLLSASILLDEQWDSKAELAEELPEKQWDNTAELAEELLTKPAGELLTKPAVQENRSAESIEQKWALLQEDYIRKIEGIFPEKAADEKWDGFIQLIGQIMAGIEGHAGFEKLHAALSRIEKRYRTAQIDFKR